MKASRLAGEEFLGRLNFYGRSWLPARDLVLDALSRRTNVDPSGRIIVFDLYAPWKVNVQILAAMIQKAHCSNRSTCLSWSRSWLCPRMRNPTTSSIQTRPPVIGGFKQLASLQRASRVARRYLSLGAGSETRIFRASQVLTVVSSCTHLDLLGGTRQRTALWRWLKGQ